jgi:hypothetical protein
MVCLIKREAHPREVPDLKVIVEAVNHCLRLEVVFKVSIDAERLVGVVWGEHAAYGVDR